MARTETAIAGVEKTLTATTPGVWSIPNRSTVNGPTATVKYDHPGERTILITSVEEIVLNVLPAEAPAPPIVVGPSEPEGKKLVAGDNFAAEAEALRAGGTLLLPYGVTYPTNRMARLKGGVTLGAYGDPSRGKPKVRTQGGVALWAADVNGGTVQDIDFASAIDPVGEAGIVIRNANGWTVRRCNVSNFREGLQVQGVGRDINGFTLRESLVCDCWTSGDKSQGIYMSRTLNWVVERNVFDQNGYQSRKLSAEDNDSPRNHNCYFQSDNGPGIFRNNVVSRASSHGLQLRCGGECSGNIFIDNAVDLTVGYVVGATPKPGGVVADAFRNIHIGGGDVENVNRGWAMDIGNAKRVRVNNILIAHKRISTIPMILVQKSQRLESGSDLPSSQQDIEIGPNVFAWNNNQPIIRVGDGFNVRKVGNIGAPPPVAATRDAMLGPDVFASIRANPETAAAELLARGYQAVGLQ